MYQRGKLDMPGVVARLNELLRACPEFPEAEAMLNAAQRGTLRPDTRGFNEATLPPRAGSAGDEAKADEDDEEGDEEDDGERVTVPSDIPNVSVEARIKTPRAPGIPRAPALPRFTPRENVAPSYAPLADVPTVAELELELNLAPPPPPPPGSSQRNPVPAAQGSSPRNSAPPPPGSNARSSAPPPTGSSPRHAPLSTIPPSSSQSARRENQAPIAVDLGPPARERITAPSPGAPGPSAAAPPTVFAIATWLSERDFERALAAVERLGAESSPELSLLEVRALVGLGRKAA
ncbi:MAG TPA: hypothetical protein VEQ58_15985, partial [Polyangiaceae bacterium]|nr:hypothetical protein [Polyangiaceae bacterium]